MTINKGVLLGFVPSGDSQVTFGQSLPYAPKEFMEQPTVVLIQNKQLLDKGRKQQKQ